MPQSELWKAWKGAPDNQVFWRCSIAKTFYTDHDIEDLVKRGIMSLTLNDNIVLTDLAYEKAKRLGMSLITAKAYTPPAAPVRPYVSKENQQNGFERKLADSPPTLAGSTTSFTRNEVTKPQSTIAEQGKENQHLGIVELAKRNPENSGPKPGYPMTVHESKPDINKIRALITENIQLRYGQVDKTILEKMINRMLSNAGLLK